MINVVNKRVFKGEHGIFIGRGSPLGNDWSHKKGTKAKYIVDSVEDAVREYEKDLLLKIKLKDKTVCDELNRLYKYHKEHGELNLICYCKWKGDEPCHGDVIKNILENVDKRND
uniref:DUF4326 domain-containing protein n=1 Tax=Araucaria cunninghamii TaxID=56994 RepID=A0A0D6QU71_ARACU